MEALAQAYGGASGEGYEVYAFDLLGQGRSTKPNLPPGSYSIDLWAQQLDDFVREVVAPSPGGGVVLCGNSLGSLVALTATAGDQTTPAGSGYLSSPSGVKGICMFNSAVGLNIRGMFDGPLLKAVLFLLDALLFNNRFVLGLVLDRVVTKELLREALTNLYLHDPSQVDDELVDSFYGPAKGEGAAGALSQIYTNDPGLSPMQLHAKYPALDALPIHLVWGTQDLVTPITGGVGKFYTARSVDPRRPVSLEMIEAGHVPMDDNSEQANTSLIRWLEAL
eukprot:CAMPEP_0172634752 /NCGR_PEP_ID=MMETSP1068-20121228/196049_1 /TAXON_ID=35684 /ORGANISM="Pseudopedinella elastica, Strain CCMP716" /LENGTH=278 /DNA_ID=CAMNT_0013446755 /DNA_START=350 /DNA_END=1186 /DNA_ORIENTATION=+